MKRVHYQEFLGRYQRLIDVSHHLTSMLDLNSLLHHIMQEGIGLVDAVEASILFYNSEKNVLFFECSTNQETEHCLHGMVVPTESIAGWVAQNRAPVIVADVHKEVRWFGQIGEFLKFDTRSIIAVPLIAKDILIGVLEVLNKKQGTFDQDDQDILSVLGAQAAIAIQNARLFEQSDTISELVHEIRTPISSIMTISYLLQRPDLDEPRRLELAKTIQIEAQRLNQMATEFLDYTRLEAGRMPFQMAPVNVALLMKECQQVVWPNAVENQVNLQLRADPDLPPISADRSKIKQVLMNLFNNGIKYNQPGGSLYCEATHGEKHVIIKVRDTGIGIPADELPHIFEKYYRSRISEKTRAGTGLGLSITKRIVESHGGTIQVSSKVNEGSCFTVSLPFLQNPLPKNPAV
jgi:signal transduction histidine kinase